MRSGQPPDRIVRGFLSRFVTAGRRNDRFSPTALALFTAAKSAAFAKAGYESVISRSQLRNHCGSRQRPSSCSGSEEPSSGMGEEAATPKATSRAYALF